MAIEKVVRFLKDRYTIPERDYIAEDYKNSDFGRTYGWWVLLDGLRVASLEYRCFLEEPVHLYSVSVLHETFFRIGDIQSKYATGYSKQGLQMAAVGDEMIVVQNLFIPKEYYVQKHKSVTDFHETLLANAEQSRSESNTDGSI